MVRFLTFAQIHGKPNTGSTNIRVKQLLKYWPEADLYKYGEKPDVFIFQKVYWLPDYYLLETYKAGIKILDICDPDWLDNAYVKRSIDAVDGVSTSSKELADFVSQMTDKPVKHIADRFDTEKVPKLKKHKGKLKNAVWFGYAHNADVLKYAVRALEKLSIPLTVIAEEDPAVWKYATDSENYRHVCKYYKYDEETIYERLQAHDFCLLPVGDRPKDRFKSNNKTVKAWFAGLPVATNIDEIEALMSDIERNKQAEYNYKQAHKQYDVRESVKEYQQLIDEIKNHKKGV